MNIFNWIKYNQLTKNVCTSNCDACPYEQECTEVTNHTPLVIKIWRGIQNCFIDFAHWIEVLPYKNKKMYYRCVVCGKIEAPYFEDGVLHNACIFDDFGWLKAYHSKWVCHQCCDHGYATDENECDEPTYNRWHNMVIKSNKRILALIKSKDAKFYDEHDLSMYEEDN